MHSPPPALSRFAIFTAAVILLVIAAGAYITSMHQASFPVPSFIGGAVHATAGLTAGLLGIALLIWLAPSNTRTFIRAMSWIAVAAYVGDVASSEGVARAELPAGLAILHALLAPVFLGCTIAIAVFTRPEMAWEPEFVDVSSGSSLSRLAFLTPAAVLLQISLGAAYRYKALSVMPHMGGAMLVALLLLILCIQILQIWPNHASLRPIAVVAMTALLVQIFLGIVVFIMRLLDFDTSAAFVALSVAHISVGSLVFASALVLAIDFQRCTAPSYAKK